MQVTQPSSRTSQAQTATEGHEPSTSSLTTTSLPRAPETTDPVVASPPATDETVQHCETRAIRQMRVTTERNELTIWLQLEDMMNRQLTTEFSHDEDPNMLTQDLVTHGFICESDAERLGAVLTAALKASADLAQSTGDDITTGSSMYALTEEAARRLDPQAAPLGGGAGGSDDAPVLVSHPPPGVEHARPCPAPALTHLHSQTRTLAAMAWLRLAALLALASAVATQHGTVGRPCEVSTDCGTGNYCAGNKRCACLTTYVEIDSYCWRKINPGESGCTQNRQCEAVWPGAYCRSGECRCANNQPPFRTRDGLVCLNYGFCPLNGNNPKFRIENQVQQCYGGADATCEAIGALAYDCVCDSDDCTVNNPISFCCPSRAFACIQPPNEGYTPPGGGTTLNHWYHDPITGECRELKYQGYACNRGLPLYRDRTTGVKQEPVYCQGNDNGCNNPNYQCTTMGTLQQCCPTYLFICSRNGGIPTEVYNTAGGLPTEYFDVGIPDGTGTTSPRFYYDSREGRCIQFSSSASAGEPLKDSSGERNMECSPTGSGANSCPSTHSCESTSGSTTFGGVCCPRPQYVCKLPREQGNCGTYSNRWWFNAKTGNCEEFIYSGCQGNANNFETYKECQDYCRDARSEPQCIQGTALTDSNGNFIICGGTTAASTTCPANHYCYYDGTTYGCCPTQAVTRWYYDSTTRTCQTYSFNGCDGNSNNFATQQDCKDYCRVESCPDGGEVGSFQGVERAERSSTCMYHESPVSVHPLLYAGDDMDSAIEIRLTSRTETAGLVANTKATLHTRDTVRRLKQPEPSTRPNRCVVHRKTLCALNHEMSVYDAQVHESLDGISMPIRKAARHSSITAVKETGTTLRHKNPVKTTVLSEACPPGTVVAKDGEGSRLVQCSNPGGQGRVSGGCPDGYTCYSSPLLDQSVCCGASTELQSLCPTSSTPFISALSLQPMQCTPNVDGACPGNFFCWFSTTATSVNAFYCCRSPDSVDTGCESRLFTIAY
ncbi:Kunitz/Bovine pancreatic trypsin inhibitor domain protein [Ostertagia ostertagi]